MKARQIAIAPGSVYAIGPLDQVRSIERGEDGLWGDWQATAATAKEIVHGGEVIGIVEPDGSVSAFQRVGKPCWFTWVLKATELSAVHLPGVGPVLFATAPGGMVWCARKHTPDSPWTNWEPLDGPVANIKAAVIPGGGLVVFGIRDGIVYHRWQDRPLSPWKGWTSLDGPPGGARVLGVTTIKGGGLVVFALGKDGGLYHRWQNKPFDPWQNWESVGDGVKSFSVTKSPDGGLAVFAIGVDDGVRFRYQKKPFAKWGPWTGLKGTSKSIAAQMSYADGLEVFGVGMDDGVYHTWCARMDWPWTAWSLLDYEASPLRSGIISSSPPITS